MAEEKNKEAVETENKVEETNKSEEVNSDNVEENKRTGLENLKVLEIYLEAITLLSTNKTFNFGILLIQYLMQQQQILAQQTILQLKQEECKNLDMSTFLLMQAQLVIKLLV